MNHSVAPSGLMALQSPLLDELDADVVAALVRHVKNQVPQVFPTHLPVVPLSHIHYEVATHIDPKAFDSLLDLIDANLAAFYVREQGPNWRLDKTDEMRDPGLLYVWYTDLAGDVVGFVSFSVVNEQMDIDTKTVLYLYEIHVSHSYQSLGIGSTLLDTFHAFGGHLKRLVDVGSHGENGILSQLYSTNLTVFARNKRAVDWYFKKGYVYTADSPVPRLRSGRLPAYYLLYRVLE